jgi:hypothetical protein
LISSALFEYQMLIGPEAVAAWLAVLVAPPPQAVTMSASAMLARGAETPTSTGEA